jgi:alpha-L-glutamate ligase-like protein
MLLERLKALRTAGVLGLNQRNGEYLFRYNPRHLFPLVDDKRLTKDLALKHGISVPQLYHALETPQQAKNAALSLQSLPGFAVKPAHGSGGEGILVVEGRVKTGYRLVSGEIIRDEEFSHHVNNVLSGLYSLGGLPDAALIEERVIFDQVFSPITYRGVPDIRIIVFLGVPVMAMLRLPTRQSDGKANLHKGAIGVGIDLSSGSTLKAVQGTTIVDEHPDTGASVAGRQIPHWERLLEIASSCFQLTGLGYQGVDLVLDATRGPLMLEVNARPGLSIQIANRAGLETRLRKVKDEFEGASAASLATNAERIRFAQQHFGEK